MRHALLLLGTVLLACAAAQAQVLYKWTDAQGKLQYSDQPPKNFSGVVTRIEPDIPASPWAAPAKAAVAAPPAKPAEAAPADLNTRRRETREKLGANVDRARAQLEAARTALQEAQDVPRDDERQVIQQRVSGRGNTGTPQTVRNPDPTQGGVAGGGMHGMSGRSNCRDAKGADGKVVAICPSSLLRPEYFERLEALEAAVKKAEAELEAAQDVYRRNVD